MLPGRHQAHVVCGGAGAGKSTFAARLCAELGAVLLDMDTVTERLTREVLRAHGLPEDDRDSPAYKALLREPNYETLFDVACDNLPHLPCVIVGPFTRERRQADWPERLAARLATSVQIHYVCCSLELRRERLHARGNPRDRAKLASFAEYASQSEDVEALPFPHQRVDSSET
jgi:predicted kinase